MKVITTSPIIYDQYSNAFGDKFKSFVQKQKQEGSLFNKAKKLVNTYQAGKSAQNQPSQSNQPIQDQQSVPTSTPIAEKKGLSTGAKIGIGVAGLAIIGLSIFLVTRNKK